LKLVDLSPPLAICFCLTSVCSRLSNDTTRGFGDPDDVFGALGANGAQKLAADVRVRNVSGPLFAPQCRKVSGFPVDSI
jgi:hypothetical protein